MSGSLLTQPLRLGFRGAGLVIHETVSVSQRVLRLLGLAGAPAEPATDARTTDPPQAEEPIPAPPAAARTEDPPAERIPARPAVTPPAATAPAVATAPVAAEPAHVSESPELVEE